MGIEAGKQIPLVDPCALAYHQFLQHPMYPERQIGDAGRFQYAAEGVLAGSDGRLQGHDLDGAQLRWLLRSWRGGVGATTAQQQQECAAEQCCFEAGRCHGKIPLDRCHQMAPV